MTDFALEARKMGEQMQKSARDMEWDMARCILGMRDQGRISPAVADQLLEALDTGETPLWWVNAKKITLEDACAAMLVNRVIVLRDEAIARMGD